MNELLNFKFYSAIKERGLIETPNIMSTLKKLVLITNLLYSGRSISVNHIKEKFGISERTVYRYIDHISRAGIPLYYDKDLKGYMLSRYAKLQLNQLDINEMVIAIVALVKLMNKVEGFYKESIQNLIAKIEGTGKVPLEEIISLVETRCRKEIDCQQLSELLTSSLLQTAIKINSRINITLSSEGKPRAMILESPKLKFKSNWAVLSVDGNNKEEVPLSKIEGIQIKTLSENM